MRRKFHDITKLIKSKKESNTAHKALNIINYLYLIEKKIRLENLDYESTYKLRNDKSRAKLEELRVFAEQKIETVLEGSPIYKALNYVLNQYQYLQNYLLKGYLDIDNNKTENAIRPFAVGRKNWLFVGDEQGGAAHKR